MDTTDIRMVVLVECIIEKCTCAGDQQGHVNLNFTDVFCILTFLPSKYSAVVEDTAIHHKISSLHPIPTNPSQTSPPPCKILATAVSPSLTIKGSEKVQIPSHRTIRLQING